MYNDVIEFNQKIIGTKAPESWTMLNDERFEFACKVLLEEVNEFMAAKNNNDVVEALDAMIDLIYYAMGRCYEMGISPEEFKRAWDIVHEANMQKKLGNKGRGSDLDAVKPEGWKAPEHRQLTIADALEGNLEL